MVKNNIYGELLYIGFVSEKGRVFTELRKYNYRKNLKLHVSLWQRIVTRMFDNRVTDEDDELIKYLIELCKTNKEIGKYYIIQADQYFKIEKEISLCVNTVNNEEDIIIISLMNDLILELSDLLKYKIFLDKKQIHSKIRALHNLPRYFLRNTDNLIYGIKEMALDFNDAIEYSFSNMDKTTKDKYESIRTIKNKVSITESGVYEKK